MTRKKQKETQQISEYRLVLRVDAEHQLSDQQKSVLRSRLKDFLEKELQEGTSEWPPLPPLNVVSSKILFLDDNDPPGPRSR